MKIRGEAGELQIHEGLLVTERERRSWVAATGGVCVGGGWGARLGYSSLCRTCAARMTGVGGGVE